LRYAGDETRMKADLDCYPCFMRQALNASRRVGVTEEVQREIMLATMDELRQLQSDIMPPQMAQHIHRRVRELGNHRDPYREAKQASTQAALALYPHLLAEVRAAADPLETAVRIAIAGNIIDLGIHEHYDLEATLQRVLHQPFAIDDLEPFRTALDQCSRILYLGDNAGETVFDRVLIEYLDRPVTYVVKAAPIINDATCDDALAAGLDKVAEIIDNGTDAPGTLLDQCSSGFLQRFDQAELIISKGQGNYESLSDVEAPIYFLLQAKCGVIARHLGVRETDIIFKQGISGDSERLQR